MAANQDYISSAEFSRWMTEQADFRSRLEHRLGIQHGEVVITLRRIEDGVKETNGRVRGAEAQIEGIQTRLDSIEADDTRIEKVVQGIRDEGCSQYAAHVNILTRGVEDWSPKKKAAAASGLVGLGVLVWPAVQEIAALVHTLLDKVPAGVAK